LYHTTNILSIFKAKQYNNESLKEILQLFLIKDEEELEGLIMSSTNTVVSEVATKYLSITEEGIKKGIEIGEKKGIEKGRQEGRQEERQEILNLLKTMSKEEFIRLHTSNINN